MDSSENKTRRNFEKKKRKDEICLQGRFPQTALPTNTLGKMLKSNFIHATTRLTEI